MSYSNPSQSDVYRSSAPPLRHSCDACNAAKVKCSQARPTCVRCETRNAECVYSVSLRSAKGKAASFKGAGSIDSVENRNGDPKDASASTPITFPPSAILHPMISALPETNTDASTFDEWTSTIPDVDDQISFTHLGEVDDSTMFPSNAYTENVFASGQKDRHFPDLGCTIPLTNLVSYDNSPPSAQKCVCHQKILAKLADCWLTSRDTCRTFDKSLSENRIIIALCTSALSCPDSRHTDDMVLMLIIVALINQIITIYDNPISGSHTPSSSSVEEAFSYSTSGTYSTPSSRTSANREFQTQSLPLPQDVRLSLGSYQLDQQDEQILKANLLRIELGKISTLIELFEKRFCSTREWSFGNDQDGCSESRPFNELLTYLRKRLRKNHEALRS